MHPDRHHLISTTGYCLYPFAVYLLVYETAGVLLTYGVQTLRQAQEADALVRFTAHVADLSALVTALAMTAGFLAAVFAAGGMKKCGSEWLPRGTSRSPDGAPDGPPDAADDAGSFTNRMAVTAVFVMGALALSLLLNVCLSTAGEALGFSGAQRAASQTGAVSIVPGILVYGVISPIVEETVFRGITFGRIRAAAGAAGRKGSGSSREDHAGDGNGAGAHTGTENGFRQAALLSSLLFGLYHGNFIQGIYAFCMGMVLCMFLRLTGQLWTAAALHGLINASVLLLSRAGLFGRLASPGGLSCLLVITLCCAGMLGKGRNDRR